MSRLKGGVELRRGCKNLKVAELEPALLGNRPSANSPSLTTKTYAMSTLKNIYFQKV